jgi:hypothetical protein
MSTEEILQNTTAQKLKVDNSATRLTSGWLVTHPKELNITFKPQQKGDRCNFKIQLQFIPAFA